MEDQVALDAIDFELNPNSTFFLPEEDSEQVQDTNDEKAMVQASAKYIDHILDWMDEEIRLTDSITGINLESKLDVQAQILARQILKDKLTEAKIRLESLKDLYL